MSRHSKRISVFDRLGPGNDGDPSSHHPGHPPPPPPPPPPVRHGRHYSDKHNVPEDRPRDKRDPERMSRKRRHGFEDEPLSSPPVEPRSSKRDKVLPSSRRSDPRERQYSDKSRRIRSSTSHSSTEGGDSEEEKRKSSSRSSIKRSKSLRESGRRDRGSDEKVTDAERRESEHGHGDEERPRKKRERESGSDADDHRESKRRKTDDRRGPEDSGGHHYQREAIKSKEKREKKGGHEEYLGSSTHRKGGRKRSLYDSFSDSEADNQGEPEIDWFALARMPLPKLKEKKISFRDSLKAGAILSKIGVSSALAGPELMSQVQQVVAEHLIQKYGDDAEALYTNPFELSREFQFGSSLAAHIEDQISDRDVVSNIGPCRRALVASVDFNIRKKLRSNKKGSASDLLSSPATSSSWDPELYASSVSLYRSESQVQFAPVGGGLMN